MKKLIAAALIAIILTMAIIMTGCSSAREFKRVHVIETEKCYKMNDYYILSYGNCRAYLENGDKLYLTQGTYILVEDKCPICDNHE